VACNHAAAAVVCTVADILAATCNCTPSYFKSPSCLLIVILMLLAYLLLLAILAVDVPAVAGARFCWSASVTDVLAVVGFAAAAGLPTSIRLIKVFFIFYLTLWSCFYTELSLCELAGSCFRNNHSLIVLYRQESAFCK
jgi:hypothetical protein